jgi:nucleoside-diphosphate-sugar epimerase
VKAIVTGGAGFIGSHIAERLLKDGHEVMILDDFSSGKQENVPIDAKSVWCDITNLDPYIVKGVDVVFHNAASKKNICLEDPLRDLHVNGGGTLELLEACMEYGVKKFVHASTGSVYGNVVTQINEDTPTNPVSYYGVSKLAGEGYVKYYNYAHGMNTTILRYFHVYGERQEDDPALGGVVAIFKKQIQAHQPIVIHGDGNQQRVFTHVSDVVEANIQAWKQSHSSGQVYNCCSSYQVTVGELADMLMEKHGDVEREYTDPLPGDIFWFTVDNKKITESLGIEFKPFDVDLI